MPPQGAAGRADRVERFRSDAEFLAEHYPTLRHAVAASGRTASAVGALPIELPSGAVDPVEIRIEFGPRYPDIPPETYDHAGRWPVEADRHIDRGRRFCLYLDGVDEPDVRSRDGLAGYLVDVALFLRQQMICDRVGRFPGAEWPHGQASAYALHIIERLGEFATSPALFWEQVRRDPPGRNDPCPCGSLLKFKRCHVDTSAEVRRLARRAALVDLTYGDLHALAATR